jgi:hypothetical protein
MDSQQQLSVHDQLVVIFEKLDAIEKRMELESVTNKELIQELVKSGLKRVIPASIPSKPQDPKDMYFVVKCYLLDNKIEISGRTFDIRDTLKNEFGCLWVNDTKSWATPDLEKKDELLSYLSSLSEKVTVHYI